MKVCNTFTYFSIQMINKSKERAVIENAFRCLTTVEAAWVSNNCIFYCTSPVKGVCITIKPKKKNYYIIILPDDTFFEESFDYCVKVVLHEMCHALIGGKVFKLKKKEKEEKYCTDFAKSRLKLREKYFDTLIKWNRSE